MNKDFELLAPAGSFEILKAVIEAGADAVYIGGNRFGARAYANNFSEEELLEAIDYVHLRGKKLFLTVNTLFKNKEIKEELYDYLLPYYKRGLDAVIVQDFGAIAFIREHFPDLPVHTSTQMTVTGKEGALLLKEAGAERVVLARELSIAEMKEIYDKTGVELEAFIHGALCYSYSGQCLFSSILGGRSGNRGRCAQPCRLAYSVCDSRKKEYKKESYVLSLKDLCGIEYLKQFREAGVYSLKIEGRMKQASYAAGVVSFYRKYIDLENQVSKEDMKHLYELGNRCGFTTTYFKEQNGRDMITFDKPSYEKSNDALHQQIEQNYVQKESKLPIFGKLVLKKDQPMELTVSCECINRAQPQEALSAMHKDGKEYCVTAHVCGNEVSEAKNKPLLKEDVLSRMKKTGESSFVFSGLDIEMDDNIFAPNGALNQLRRDALELLKENMLAGYLRSRNLNDTGYPATDVKSNAAMRNADSLLIASFETRAQLECFLCRPYITTVYADSQAYTKASLEEDIKADAAKAHDSQKEFLFVMPAVFRSKTSEFYREKLEMLMDAGVDGFVVKNYEELYFLNAYAKDSKKNIRIVADHNLYTYNDCAKLEFAKYAICRDTIPLELNKKEIINRNNQNSEMIIYGHYPLMTTAGCVHKNTDKCDKNPKITYLKDRYKTYFPVKNNCSDCYNIIYNSVPVLLFKEQEELRKCGVCHFRLNFTVETKEETEAVLNLFEGKGNEIAYTKGHYKRGVE